jgi:hypothetical protein
MKCVLVLAALVAVAMACDPVAIDNCGEGIVYGAKDTKSFFVGTEDELNAYCDKLKAAPECVKPLSASCNENTKKYIRAVKQGYDNAHEAVCKKEETAKRENFIKNGECLKKNFENDCMKTYVKQLDVVEKSSEADKVKHACCLHMKYRDCAQASVMTACGANVTKAALGFQAKLAEPAYKEMCGEVKTDECTKFTDPDISAVGDISGRIFARHIALLQNA